jgi:GNAT superfamily N-acetyltransferase
MNIEIREFTASDRAAWEVLARGYKEFYQTPTTDAEYETAWRRILAGSEIHARGAWAGGALVGLAHFLFHMGTWVPTCCYLQDLFTVREARGKGVARALIEAVANAARARKADRYYWLTAEDNVIARRLYDKVAEFHGFIRYEYAIGQPPRPRT